MPSDKDQRQPARLTDGELIALCRAAIDDLAALKGRSADVLQDSYFLLELAEKMTRPLIKQAAAFALPLCCLPESPVSRDSIHAIGGPSTAAYLLRMEWKKPSELIAEAERRLIEGAKRIAKQCEIVSRLESIGGEAEQARKLLSQLIDAQQGQKLQLERLRAGRND